jgi:tetratricopeptide (TPR) repeat protein
MQLPGDPAEAFDRGNACLERGDAASAIAAFEHCLRLRPDHPATLFNLANAQSHAGQVTQSVETLVRCLRSAPDFGAAHINLANALLRLGMLKQARTFATTGVQLMPGSPEALLCLAGILHHAGDHTAAAATYRTALRHAPDHGGALSSLGNTLRAMGKLDEALVAHDKAVAAAPENGPDHAVFRFHRATTLLASGAFAPGWSEYEWRWRRPGAPPRFATRPWCGEPLEGRTILLHHEQGLGDTLQFVRYAPLVAQRGGRVILQVQAPLVRLLRALPGVAQVFTGGPLPPFDCHCPLMSLPHAFGTTLDNIPSTPAYLQADPVRVAAWRQHWRERSPLHHGPCVGLVWAGLPNLDSWEARLIDQRRSLAPADLAGLAGLPGVKFVSLQKGLSPPPIPGLEMIDVMAGMDDFADTAALIASLDLVISVDTAVAHLAAGLGRPVWLLSRYDGCWRWLRDRSDSPWYPTLLLYRQARPHDWPEAVACVRRDLQAMVAVMKPAETSSPGFPGPLHRPILRGPASHHN